MAKGALCARGRPDARSSRGLYRDIIRPIIESSRALRLPAAAEFCEQVTSHRRMGSSNNEKKQQHKMVRALTLSLALAATDAFVPGTLRTRVAPRKQSQRVAQLKMWDDDYLYDGGYDGGFGLYDGGFGGGYGEYYGPRFGPPSWWRGNSRGVAARGMYGFGTFDSPYARSVRDNYRDRGYEYDYRRALRDPEGYHYGGHIDSPYHGPIDYRGRSGFDRGGFDEIGYWGSPYDEVWFD